MDERELELLEKLHRLMWLAHAYQVKNRMAVGPTADTSRGQGRVLAALKMQPEIRTKDLAYVLGIRTQSLNELLGKLEENGFITRAPSPEDKRVVLVKLTEKGRNEEQLETTLSGLFDSLNEEEQEKLTEYFDRIIAAWEEQTGIGADDATFDWEAAARERLGDEKFDHLLAMRRGGNPFLRGHEIRGGFGPGGGFDSRVGFGPGGERDPRGPRGGRVPGDGHDPRGRRDPKGGSKGGKK
jgi:DNA-binding MarR family transcriptional regulator